MSTEDTIDLSKYHKLKTSNVMFYSIKGKKFIISIALPSELYYSYFSIPEGKQSNNEIIGEIAIHSTQGNSQSYKVIFPITRIISQKFIGNTDLANQNWHKIVSTQLVDPETGKSIILKRGEYVAFPDIYIPRGIPNDIEHMITIMEIDQLK